MRTTTAARHPRRLVTGALVAATLLAVLLVRDPGGSPQSSPAAPPAPAATTPTTAVAAPASVADFCAAFAELTAAHEAAVASASPATVARLRATAATTRDVAERTVEMPPTAALGIAVVLDLFASLPDQAASDGLVSSDDAPTLAEEAQADAFVAFVSTRCPAPGGRP